ncbi:hypothetical protein [Burkholderia sp. BCC1640]|uniref:hypothetical protein n=1 Tax=Burkholderia sp. BCC1640 TaxID=2676294 RepID=UPI00158991C9|nr:hypothetical protein [Burkholderia sp. BCC1640]
MKSKNGALLGFNRIRVAIIVLLVLGFVAFPFFGFVSVNYQWLSAVFVLVIIVMLIIMIGIWYRCPYCNAIPRGDPIPYVDLVAKKCSSCGRLLRD